MDRPRIIGGKRMTSEGRSPARSRVEMATQEGEDFAPRWSSGRYQTRDAQEGVDGPRVAGQASVGAVLAESFDVATSMVGERIQRGRDDQ